MAEFLKELELSQRYGMAEMNVDAGRVDAVLDAQRLARGDAPLQFLPEFAERLDLVGPTADQFDLFVDGFHEEFPV